MGRPVCLDCLEPLTDWVGSSKYPPSAGFSRIYLCVFCRTHRYKSEAHALARCQAGFARARAGQGGDRG